MELVKLKIQELTYKVAPSGKLIAIVVLQEKEGLIEDGVLKNAIILDNALIVRDMGLYVGSKVLINKTDNLNPIHEVTHSSHVTKLPAHCPSCGEKLSAHYTSDKLLDYYECTNMFCYGQSQSHIFKLIAHMHPSFDHHLMRKFLNEYVTSGNSHTDIRNITDFDKIFFSIKARDTRTRLNNWIKVHGSFIGNELFDLDMDIENKLSCDNIEKSLFWFVANIKMPSELARKVACINPQLFFSGKDTVFKGLEKKEQDYLLDNFDFLFSLLKIFKFYGSKEWI